MKIKARFFALFREVVGKGVEEFEVEEGITVGAFKDTIVQLYPVTKSYMNNITIAVNAEYAGAGVVLKNDDEVAFLPPISGG